MLYPFICPSSVVLTRTVKIGIYRTIHNKFSKIIMLYPFIHVIRCTYPNRENGNAPRLHVN
jgi:hypothetical protein